MQKKKAHKTANAEVDFFKMCQNIRIVFNGKVQNRTSRLQSLVGGLSDRKRFPYFGDDLFSSPRWPHHLKAMLP